MYHNNTKTLLAYTGLFSLFFALFLICEIPSNYVRTLVSLETIEMGVFAHVLPLSGESRTNF